MTRQSESNYASIYLLNGFIFARNCLEITISCHLRDKSLFVSVKIKCRCVRQCLLFSIAATAWRPSRKRLIIKVRACVDLLCRNMATTDLELHCSAELTRKVRTELVFLSVANTIFSITAFLGNALILVALHRETTLNKPSKLLLRGLATTDLCVGIIAEPVNVASWISLANGRLDICFYTEWASFVIGYILCSVSLVTLTAISVDRLLALLLGLRYQQIVTVKKTYATIVFVWVFYITCTLSYFGNPLIQTWVIIVSLCLFLVTTIFSYTKIILTLRQSQILVHSHNGSVARRQAKPSIPLNITRYRKAVYNALWVQVTLVVCYLPYGIMVALTNQNGISVLFYLAGQFTVTLVYLNSSLNPFLYCWKMRDVRQAVKSTTEQHFSCS